VPTLTNSNRCVAVAATCQTGSTAVCHDSGGCGDCGAYGQACCTVGFGVCTAQQTSCSSSSTCMPCGGQGQPCCGPNNWCAQGRSCNLNTCS
jgi:hypothetical protein